MRAVQDAGSDACSRIKVAPISDGVIAFSNTSIGSIVDVEGDGYIRSLSDVRANADASHISVELVELGT